MLAARHLLRSSHGAPAAWQPPRRLHRSPETSPSSSIHTSLRTYARRTADIFLLAGDNMSTLAAARADNFYYPPEWSPRKGGLNKLHGRHALRERARMLDLGILIISPADDPSCPLAVHERDTPDRWHNIARAVGGGKSVDDVRRYYELLVHDIARIEAGKKKAVHKTATTDDKLLQSTLKRVGINTIPVIEEVNIFKDDLVIQFLNPKVQGSIAANTWVLQDVLPSIINQLGPDNMEHLKRIAEEMRKQVAATGAIQPKEENDDDVPELVPGETFEEVAQETKA
ncbi:hypothetical protein ZWY2020_016435 [Hordeum vulgare]|nr:hypothetical protein ZWY2020_016435 [Hordeum vulgare]